MDEHRRVAFADWVGETVVVFFPGGAIPAEYGVLEEVNDWGLVLRHPRRISWPSADTPDETTGRGARGGQDLRNVTEFRPWHMISSVRVLEPEEREAHGL
jgi:hypothetical protein